MSLNNIHRHLRHDFNEIGEGLLSNAEICILKAYYKELHYLSLNEQIPLQFKAVMERRHTEQ